MLRTLACTVALSVLPLAAHAQELRFDVIQESLPLKPGDIVSAEVKQMEGRWVVAIELAATVKTDFGVITGRNLNKPMQIVLGDRIVATPIIRTAITGGSLIIEGGFTEASARELAMKLKP